MPGPAYLYSRINARLFLLRREFSSSVQYLRACSRWKVPATYIPVLVVLLILAALSMSDNLIAQTTINTSGGNGMASDEGTSIASSGGATPTDSIWADMSNHRWLMSNYGGANITVASWPCNSSPGCIVISGAASPYAETPLPISTVLTGAFLQQTSGTAPYLGWSGYSFPTGVCSNNIGLISNGTIFNCAGSPFAQTGTTNTFSMKQTFAASTTSAASINIPAGTAPSSPADGDQWYDTNQQAEAFQQTSSTTIYRGGAISGCVNVSPVSVSGSNDTSLKIS
jgi:hypothetical protein